MQITETSRLPGRLATVAGPGALAAGRRWSWRLSFEASVEQLALAAGLFWALTANHAFLAAALRGRSLAEPSAWAFGAALFVLLVLVHALLLGLVANRWTIKPLLTLLLVATACASHYMEAFGVHLDPAMLRNVLHTNTAEAGELLTRGLALHLLLYAGLPLALLWRVRVTRRQWLRAAGIRAGVLLLGAAIVALTLLSIFQPLASLVRNQRELRYLITPANYLWSAVAAVAAERRGAGVPRRPIGLDATAGDSWNARRKPLVVVLVVGETARAANWGLSGYARQTTPQLAQLDVVNFVHATSCGTDTETSLPCMFAPVGRRSYEESRIRAEESLLHVASRAGVAVRWRDNQSGCKAVCAGLPSEKVQELDPTGLCADGQCLDEGLVGDLAARLRSAQGTQLWVLHMLGNHGPAYFRRHTAQFARFQPECRDDDLRHCTVAEVINAYDNALLYTDQVLAEAVRELRKQSNEVDSALIYVSDHGESLGEHGLFLHGVPYAIAPDVQTRVPMVIWLSEGFERGAGFADGCLRTRLRQRAAQPAAHDHLFHTVLGLLDVRTQIREPGWDLTEGCRAGRAAASDGVGSPSAGKRPLQTAFGRQR